MAYARYGQEGSDAYVFRTEAEDGSSTIEIQVEGRETVVCDTPADALDVLWQFRSEGLCVPESTIERLWQEAAAESQEGRGDA